MQLRHTFTFISIAYASRNHCVNQIETELSNNKQLNDYIKIKNDMLIYERNTRIN